MQVIAGPIFVSSHVITLLSKLRALHPTVCLVTMQQCYLSTIRKGFHRWDAWAGRQSHLFTPGPKWHCSRQSRTLRWPVRRHKKNGSLSRILRVILAQGPC